MGNEEGALGFLVGGFLVKAPTLQTAALCRVSFLNFISGIVAFNRFGFRFFYIMYF